MGDVRCLSLGGAPRATQGTIAGVYGHRVRCVGASAQESVDEVDFSRRFALSVDDDSERACALSGMTRAAVRRDVRGAGAPCAVVQVVLIEGELLPNLDYASGFSIFHSSAACGCRMWRVVSSQRLGRVDLDVSCHAKHDHVHHLSGEHACPLSPLVPKLLCAR